MINATDDFTGDTITLVTGQSGAKMIRETFRDLINEEGRSAEVVREAIVDCLSPIMRRLPPYVQQITARVLMEHVDWDAVAAAILTDPEMN
jgi:hypothetical protein